MNGVPFFLLLILSAFTMNLMLQCALGIKGAASLNNSGRMITFIKLAIAFFAVILLWVLFTKVIFYLFSGIFIYILSFPVSYMVYEGLEYLIFRNILKKDTAEEYSISFTGGITSVILFICINIANNFFQTILLSFGFTAGIYLVFIIVKEVCKRAALEAVPRFLRGKPLLLITMGMLSLIFTAASLLFLGMIEIK